MSNRRKQALGKGLEALLSSRSPAPATTPSPQQPSFAVGMGPATFSHFPSTPVEEEPETGIELKEIPISALSPNPRQPRKVFEPDALRDLADSIRVHGVLQPVLVSPAPQPGRYILLAGERRLRACELAGKETIPARVVEASEAEQLEFAIIENVQREDLDPVEEARAYQELATVFGYSQEEIADRVGKSRVAVTNSLRLLKLPEQLLQNLQAGLITPGHARALLMLHHPLQQQMLRSEIETGQLSVRQAEDRARQIQMGQGSEQPKRTKKSSGSGEENLDVHALQEKLILSLGCKVRLKARTATSGLIEIQYQNLDDLDRILDVLNINMDEG